MKEGGRERIGSGSGSLHSVFISPVSLSPLLPPTPTPTQRHLAKNDSLIQKAAFLKAVFQRLREKRERS